MFNFGPGELMILLLIVLLLFGPSQLPKLARGLGEAMREFKKAQNEIHTEITREEPSKPSDPPKPTA